MRACDRRPLGLALSGGGMPSSVPTRLRPCPGSSEYMILAVGLVSSRQNLKSTAASALIRGFDATGPCPSFNIVNCSAVPFTNIPPTKNRLRLHERLAIGIDACPNFPISRPLPRCRVAAYELPAVASASYFFLSPARDMVLYEACANINSLSDPLQGHILISWNTSSLAEFYIS
jgi:hypothetical protein